MLNLDLLTNHASRYKICYCLFHAKPSKRSPQVLIHVYTLRLGHVKSIVYLNENLSPQIIILRDTDPVSKFQHPIQHIKVQFQSISNLLYHLCTPLINGLSSLNLIKQGWFVPNQANNPVTTSIYSSQMPYYNSGEVVT